jgi:hypothetical protein
MNIAVLRAFVAATALALAFFAAPAPPLAADATSDAIKTIRELERSGDETLCVAKMLELADSEDPRVLALMREFLKSRSDKVACAAMDWIAFKRDSEFYRWLVAHIEDKDLYRRRDGRPEVYKTLLVCVGAYLKDNQDKSVLKPLEDVVDRFLSTDSEYATRAVRAYGVVRDPAVVETLLRWFDQVDSHGQSQSGKDESPETRRRKDEMRKALVETLRDLCGPDIPDAATWRRFWQEKKKGFVFPAPRLKDVEVDVTTLTEWTDPVYGYRVRRPEGAWWTFKGKDEWFRIQASKTDDTKTSWCLAAWGVYKLDDRVKDLKAFADWWVEQEFGNSAAQGLEFDEFSAGGEPKVEEKKFAGREWTVVTAKGKAKGGFIGWGVMERRVYITKLEYLLLYAVGTVRSGAEPEDKKKTWDFIEGVTFEK